MKGLQPKKSQDVQGPTACRTIRFEVDMLEWLASLSGGVNYHVREAVRLYQENYSKKDRDEP
jgi:hypothetical protein